MVAVTLVNRDDIYPQEYRNLPLDEIELGHILMNADTLASSNEIRFIDPDGKSKTLR